ncbi:MAG: GntR family transcriptional regulator [Eubacteriales bacterium]|nr:GntR family transcriptional regulator [Eubacteriales bacterium]
MRGHIPTYIKLKSMIQRSIEKRELVPGEKLPSERTLAVTHGLSRMTVRQALSELVTAGALYREQGRGTFVSARKMQQRNIASFSETVRQKGFAPSTRVLEFSSIKPPKDIADKLMAVDAEMYRALRIRLADDIPVALEEVFIPFHICPGLEKKDLTASLYKLIGDTFGHKIASADSSVTALHPNAKQQEHLRITRNTPVLKIDSLYFSGNGQTLYYEHAVYRADMYEYNIRISTQPGK